MVFKNSMLGEFRYKFPRLASGLLVLAMLWLSVGCAEEPRWTEEQRDALEQRVRQRWQALEKHDFGEAWEYTSPNFRARFPKHLYIKKFSYAVAWELTGVEVVNYDSDAAVASVVVRVMSSLTKQTSAASMRLGTIPRTLRERWLLIEGQWWYSANY